VAGFEQFDGEAPLLLEMYTSLYVNFESALFLSCEIGVA
jgi:hypothetical protein